MGLIEGPLVFAAALAFQRAVGHLALDTSEQAHHLIRFYESRGYQLVESARWPDVNFRSVILAKAQAAMGQAI
jgi:hypothetical protein